VEVRKYSFSLLNMYATCPKMYEWRVVKGLVLVEGSSVPLVFGTAIHAALDEWYKSKDVEKAEGVFEREWEGMEGKDRSGKRTLATGKGLLRAYDHRYRDADVELMESEWAFELDLGGGFYYCGKVDKVVKWLGALAVVDHKTTTGMSDMFMQKVWPNMQFGGYVIAAREKYAGVNIIVLDALAVSKVAKKVEKRADEDLGRAVAQLEEWEVEWVRKEIMSAVVDVSRAEDEGHFRCNMAQCIQYNALCPYRRLCCAEGEREREGIVRNEYKKEPLEIGRDV
jgi:hypothetical protein